MFCLFFRVCSSGAPSGTGFKKILTPRPRTLAGTLLQQVSVHIAMESILYFFLIILGFFLFRLIVSVVLPITRTVRQVRREFAHQQAAHQQASATPKPGPASPAGTKAQPNWDKLGDYIDFEDVK
jgi:hypothetical protein